MKTLARRLAVALAGLLLAAGCTGPGSTPGSSPASASTDPPASPAPVVDEYDY